MQLNEYEKQMDRLGEAFGKKVSGEIRDAYWDALKSWKPEDMAWVVTTIIQNDDRFPKMPRFGELFNVRSRDHSLHESNPVPLFKCAKCQDWFAVSYPQLDGNRNVICPNYGDVQEAKCSVHYSPQYLKKMWDSRLGSLSVDLASQQHK